MNLPNRRDGETVVIEHEGQSFDVSFNRSPATGMVVECFYSDTNKVRHGSFMYALLSDACIAISKRCENGETFADIAASFGENRAPGATTGPPASILGAIACAGAALDGDAPKLNQNMSTGGKIPQRPTHRDTRNGRLYHKVADGLQDKTKVVIYCDADQHWLVSTEQEFALKFERLFG